MSDFPTSIDELDDKEDGVDYPQAADINNLNDAVEKVQAKVGADSSAVATSLDYIIKNTTSGHNHDGVDSKKVTATNLNPTGLTASQLLRVNSGATAIESSGKTVPTGDIVGTSDSQTLTSKTLTSPVLNTGLSGTAFLDEDNMASDSATKAASQQSIKAYVDATVAGVSLASVWPVGSIFISAVSTNPATLLGFGTWTAFGAGRVLVGRDSTDADFDTAEETGGAKTITLTGAQSGTSVHTHIQNAHTHTVYGKLVTASSGGANSEMTSGSDSGNRTTSSTTPTNQNSSAANAAEAHSNVQPYIVTYFWKRTA